MQGGMSIGHNCHDVSLLVFKAQGKEAETQLLLAGLAIPGGSQTQSDECGRGTRQTLAKTAQAATSFACFLPCATGSRVKLTTTGAH